MKATLPLLFAVLVFDALYAQEDIDPFAPVNGPDNAGEVNDAHRWDDQIVKFGDPHGPAYISIGGTHNKSLDRVDIMFKVDLKKYQDAVAHPDLNRGVVLMSGRIDAPDLYTWLRPFQIAGKEAYFIVSGSREQFEKMHLAFIPQEGKRRFVYNLAEVARKIIEKKDANLDKKMPNKSPLPTGKSPANSTPTTTP